MESKSGSLNSVEAKKWITNTILFASPAILIYLFSVQQALNTDGFAWSDFAITTLTLGAIFSWAISTAIDFLKKLSEGK